MNKDEYTDAKRRIAMEFHKIALGRKDDVSRLVREYLGYEQERSAAALSAMPDSERGIESEVLHEWEDANGKLQKTDSIKIVHPMAAAGEWYEKNPYDESKKLCRSVARLVAVTDEYFASIDPAYKALFASDDILEQIELASLGASSEMGLSAADFCALYDSALNTVSDAWAAAPSNEVDQWAAGGGSRRVPSDDEIKLHTEKMKALQSLGKQDAVKTLMEQFKGKLKADEIAAGWGHMIGLPEKERIRMVGCKRTQLHAKTERFYKVTGWPKLDLRDNKGGIGKKLRFDESRDAKTIETEH